MVPDVVRQRAFALEVILQHPVGHVARDHHRTGQRQAGSYRMLGQFGPDLRHRSIEIDLDCLALEHLVPHLGQETRWISLKLLQEHAVSRDLRACLAVGAAAHADGDRQARTMPR